MAEQVTQPAEGDEHNLKMAALEAQLEALATSQEALQQQMATPPALEVPPTPAPEPPPEPAGRITRQAYDELAAYAAQRAQETERFKLAVQHGLEPEDLEGEFGSPQMMQQYAEMLALRRQVRSLEESLQEGLAPPTPPEGEEEEEPEVPPGDLGGPTGEQSAEQVAVQQQYDAAKALGRTVAGRRAMLQAIYSDPTKRSLVRERTE